MNYSDLARTEMSDALYAFIDLGVAENKKIEVLTETGGVLCTNLLAVPIGSVDSAGVLRLEVQTATATGNGTAHEVKIYNGASQEVATVPVVEGNVPLANTVVMSSTTITVGASLDYNTIVLE